MANLPEIYNAAFLANPGQNNAAGYGITIKPADVPPGADYWRIVGIAHLTGKENGGNHHAYADVLDEQGKRIYGARVGVTNAGTSVAFATIDKPADEAGTNVPMHWNDTLSLKVLDTLSSDEALGFHIRHDNEEDGNTRGHHSFYALWQRTTKAGTDPDDDLPTDEPAPSPGFKVQVILHDDERIRLTQVVWVKPSKTLSADAEAVALALALEAHERDHPIEAYQRELRKKVEEEGGEE